MASDDEKTAMFNPEAQKKEAPGPTALRSRSTATVDPQDEKTMLYGHAAPPEGDADLHSANTILSDPRGGLPDWARQAAVPPETARHPAPAVAKGGGFLSVLGGLGMFLGFLLMGADILPHLQGAEDWMVPATMAFGAAAMLLVGVGFFGTLSRTNALGAIVALLGLIAAAARGMMVSPFIEGEFGKILMVAAIMGPAIVLLVASIWAFTASSAVGGGLGVTTGILLLLGGGAVTAYYLLVLLGSIDPDDDLAIALLLGGSGLAGIGCITGGVAVIKTA
jgi:hypothetical protein